MARITVGVDTGKLSHHAAAYEPGGDRAQDHLRFSVDRPGFERFVVFLRSLADQPHDVLVGVESTGHYHQTLVEFLLAAGYTVVTVSPYQATQFRRSLGKKAKTDRLDAQALARFLAATPTSPVRAPDERLAELRALTRFRTDLVQERTAALNRLHGALDLAFPELLPLVPHLASRTTLALLQTYPTAASISEADPDELGRLLATASQGQVPSARAGALQEAARTSIASRQAATALAHRIRTLTRQIMLLSQEIADLEHAIEQVFAQVGHRPQDFPVGGAVALATILAEAGDVTRFPSAKQFLAHFGWCPVDKQSGQYKDAHPRLSKAGNRFVRRIIWMLALHSISHSGPYRAYFDQRTSAGKNKMDTLVAIGRKVLATIYAILKTGRPYDPAYSPASVRRAPALTSL